MLLRGSRVAIVAALLAGLTLLLGMPGPVRAVEQERAAEPKVRVELLSEVASIAPGEPFWLALRQEITPGWHTYWMNPGDSGEPPRIEWTLPSGFTAADFSWPPPERIAVGPAMTYGYSKGVVLPIAIRAPRDLTPGSRVTLRGQASWIVCEKICIPEEAPIAVTLPVSAGPARLDPRSAPVIAAARRSVPAPSPWPASFTATPDILTLTIGARGLAADRIAEVWFYPGRWGAIEQAAPQRVSTGGDAVTLAVARGPLPDAVAAPIDGVLVVTERLDGGLSRQAFTLRAEPRALAGAHALSLLRALSLALAGGLLLNLMPCVLPVLSMKAFGLVRHAGEQPIALRRHGIVYTAGVLASFAVVAGALLALRAGGEQLGWGFQLQSPVFVTLLALVLFAVALSLSGVIVIGSRWTGAGQALAGRAGDAGSFFTGALATVAATPCTAPFMGVAVGYAVTQPWLTALLVFEALGLGLALPFLLLTLVPAWRRWLPAPGAWMTRLQQLLAFPLYASVAWLVWVVSQQAGPQGVAAALAGLVLIAFAAWLHGLVRDTPGLRHRVTSVIALALVVIAVAIGVFVSPGSAARSAGSVKADGWEPFSPARLAELRAAGTPVFVNITAAWCLTCLVNERVALRAPAVEEAFTRKGVVMLKADWTRRDPVITQVLGTFGRNGVPLYLLYPVGGATREPAMLPQILSERILIDATKEVL